MDVLDLSLGLCVEVNDSLAGGRVCGLLKVGAESGEEAVGTASDAVALVRSLGPVSCVVLLVKIGQGSEEPGRDTMLVVQLDCGLQGSIANDITVGQVLSQNAGAGLLLLSYLIRVPIGVALLRVDVILEGLGGRGDRDVRRAELRVVEQQSSLGCRLLLEDDSGTLGLALGDNLEVLDLAAAGFVLPSASHSRQVWSGVHAVP